jgi:anti-sigma factor RsiW
MSARVNPEQLMMDALDGMISDRDRKLLQAYFAVHPEESATFEQMQGIDETLRAVPAAVPPIDMAHQVMRAVSRTELAKPPLRAAQLALLIGIASVLVVFAGLIVLGLYLLLSAFVPPDSAQAAFTFVRGLAEVTESLFSAMAVFMRAAFTQPIAWAVALGLIAVVALWLRVMVAVLVPSLRLTPAAG